MKKTVSALLILVFLFTFISCAPSYRDDVVVNDLIEAIRDETDKENKPMAADDGYIKNIMKIDTSLCSEYVAMVPDSSTNMDEYGVFKASDENKIADLKKQVDAYIKSRQDAWMPEYLPNEYPKIRDAVSYQAGLYVFYSMLADPYADAAFGAFTSGLKEAK